MAIVLSYSNVVDVKTGWDSSQWECTEPLHYKQTDSINCGVLVCVVSIYITGDDIQAKDFIYLYLT